MKELILSLGKFSKHGKDLVKRELYPLQPNLFQWSKKKKASKNLITNLLQAIRGPIQRSCHLFLSCRQQLPGTNSSCHPTKGHLYIFRKSSENFKAKQMTKYLIAFSCLLAILTPVPCKCLPAFPDILGFTQVMLSSQGIGLVIHILHMERLSP